MNDADVLDQVRDALGGVRMAVPINAIIARGRTRQRRRRGITACAVAGVALVGASLGLARSQSPSPGPKPGAAQLTAYTISAAPGGETALTLRKGAQYRLDPDALRRALAAHGIAALVTVGKTCDTAPEPEGLDRVLSARRTADGAVYLTIDPAAMPAGSEVSIGYYPNGTSFALIESAAPLHCAAQPPGVGAGAAQPRPVGPN